MHTVEPFRDILGLLTDEQSEQCQDFLRKYTGWVSIKQIHAGIKAAIDNARQIYEDAMLLLDSGRFARAMTLFIAAMEELGKVSVLGSMSRIPSSNQKLWKDAWQSFRLHEHKATWAFTHTYDDDAGGTASYIVAAMQQFGLSPLCERLRQFGLYVDYHATEGRWTTPSQVEKEHAEYWQAKVEDAASRIVKLFEAGLYSERALELQREVYSNRNAARPRRKDCTLDDLKLTEARQLAKEYFRRLAEEGILPDELMPEI